MTLTLGRFRTTDGKSQILDLPSNQTRPSGSHSWDAQICDFPSVVRAHLHNEIPHRSSMNTWHDLTLWRSRTTDGKSQILDLPSNQTRPSWSHSWDAKICDFPPVVRAHLHNEITHRSSMNTWYDFDTREVPYYGWKIADFGSPE